LGYVGLLPVRVVLCNCSLT